jgi:hypothetical protein
MGILITGDGVVYTDDGLVHTDTPENCVCCDPQPPTDDWIDERDPVFPGGGGPGPGPDPNDPNKCSCGEFNIHRCTNYWADEDETDGALVVERRVRVAARIIGSLRCYAERFDSPFQGSYDEEVPFELIVDSYPGEPGDFCSATTFDDVTDTVTINGRDFVVGVFLDVSFSTDFGFIFNAQVTITPDFSPFTGGGAVAHSIFVAATSGSNTTDGWDVRVGGALFTGAPPQSSSTDTDDFPLPTGACEVRHIRNSPALAAYIRNGPIPGPINQEAGTDVVSVTVDMVAGNVIACP